MLNIAYNKDNDNIFKEPSEEVKKKLKEVVKEQESKKKHLDMLQRVRDNFTDFDYYQCNALY